MDVAAFERAIANVVAMAPPDCDPDTVRAARIMVQAWTGDRPASETAPEIVAFVMARGGSPAFPEALLADVKGMIDGWDPFGEYANELSWQIASLAARWTLPRAA